jgi:hypothetical protein
MMDLLLNLHRRFLSKGLIFKQECQFFESATIGFREYEVLDRLENV